MTKNTMKTKRKQANKAALITLFFTVFFGITLIYRSTQTDKHLIVKEGVLNNVELLGGFGNEGRNYAIILDFNESLKKYGIYAGTKEQAAKKIGSIKLTEGQIYSIHVDPTVMRGFDGYNLGIRKISNKNGLIYEENMKGQYKMGLILICFGILTSFLFYHIAKRKFK